MKASHAAVEPVAGLAAVVRAVGSADFGQLMLEFFRQQIAPVDQLVGFTRQAGRPGRTLFTVGSMPTRLSRSLTQRYLDAYHQMDPTTDELRVLKEADAWLSRLDPAMPASSVYRSFFFEHSKLVDRVAILTRHHDEIIACHGYRRHPSLAFTPVEIDRLRPWLGTLAALMRQHVVMLDYQQQSQVLALHTPTPPAERLEALSRLSLRERAVCQRLLAGLSTDAIALDLGVTANTVRSFRKKVYRKLMVSSRLELYQKYMHLDAHGLLLD